MKYQRGPRGRIDWTFIGVWLFILLSLAAFWFGVVAGTMAILHSFNVI